MAALLVVGSLASWLTHHQEMLSPLLGVLLNSLLKPDLAQAASQSLVDLAEETGPALAPYIDSILETSTQARLSGWKNLCREGGKGRGKASFCTHAMSLRLAHKECP